MKATAVEADAASVPLPEHARGMTVGPRVAPAAAAVAFLRGLSADGGRVRVLLPVSIAGRDPTEKLHARLARAPADASDAELRLDDSALGISLADQVRSRCKGRASCELWLLGYWGTLVAALPGAQAKVPTFAVVRVVADVETQAPDDTLRVYVDR